MYWAQGNTPLHLATLYMLAEVLMKDLIKKGADASMKDSQVRSRLS